MRPFAIFIAIGVLCGCKKNTGCTQFGHENYDPEAVVDDGSCIHIRDKFLGTFTVVSDCFSSTYEHSIASTQDDYILTITNLGDTLPIVRANVYGDNITIEPQAIGIGVTIEGGGIYVEEASISLSYRIRDSRSGTEVITDCFETCTKNE